MARVLLLPHAPTGGLAHLGACLAVGGELARRGHSVDVAYGGARPELVEKEGLPLHPVPEIAAEREWHPPAWYASAADLRAHVEAHLALLRRVRPDVAVASSGLAGRLACEAAGVPTVHLMHYLATSSYRPRSVAWADRLRTARHPLRVAALARSRIRTARPRRRGRAQPPVARVRADLGLPPFDGARDSAVALTTAPFLDPAAGLPAHWRYVGPLAWSPAPERTGELPGHGPRPLVYVTQGSTGDARLLRRAVADLAGGPWDVVATTGGLCEPEELRALGDNVSAFDLLPGAEVLAAADAAVVHGGHLTFCQALLSGTPFVMLPFRNDQIARLHRTERLGVGIGIYPRPRLPGRIARAVARLLRDPGYRERGERLGARLRDGWDGARGAADLAEELASGGQLGEHGSERLART